MVVQRARRDVSTPENRRLTAFLQRLWRDCRRIEGLVGDPETIALLRSIRADIGRLLHDTFLQEVVGPEGDDAVLEPIGAEIHVEDYGSASTTSGVRYLTEANPGADQSALERQHVAGADEVFQAYVCYVVAEAMELDAVGDGLRDRDVGGASFRSSQWELFYDARFGSAFLAIVDDPARRLPPRHRPEACDRPDTSCRARRKVLGRQGERSATKCPPKEVQAYMQSFGIPRIGLVFPGAAERARQVAVDDVAAHGNVIREVPIRGLGFDIVRTLPLLRQRITELECSVVPS